MSLLSEGGTELTPSLLATGTCQSLSIIDSQMYRSWKGKGVTAGRIDCHVCMFAQDLRNAVGKSTDHPLIGAGTGF